MVNLLPGCQKHGTPWIRNHRFAPNHKFPRVPRGTIDCMLLPKLSEGQNKTLRTDNPCKPNSGPMFFAISGLKKSFAVGPVVLALCDLCDPSEPLLKQNLGDTPRRYKVRTQEDPTHTSSQSLKYISTGTSWNGGTCSRLVCRFLRVPRSG